MKKKDIFLLFVLFGIAVIMIVFSGNMREGAYQGLVLAENTIIPSLLPLLIIFLLIMKTGARDVLARVFGFVSVYLFNLPMITFPAIFLGLIGGYPTGALLTQELYNNGDVDKNQAAAMLRFNFCGGCGFIITALGSARLMNLKAGIILFVSNVIANLIIGIFCSLGKKRIKREFYSFNESSGFETALITSVESAVKSVLNITAFIILFGSINSILKLPEFLLPLLEITGGVCGESNFSLPEFSAYLAFGGLCIHLQLLPVILKCGMKYGDFFISRIISALLSYCITKLILVLLPIEAQVFSNASDNVAVFSSVNLALSVLLIIGCFVLVLDISNRKRAIDN